MPTSPTTRACLYARVSTHHGQDVGLRLDALREVAAARGWVVVQEFVDEGISGSKQRRPALDALMAAAKAGEIGLQVSASNDPELRSSGPLSRPTSTRLNYRAEARGAYLYGRLAPSVALEAGDCPAFDQVPSSRLGALGYDLHVAWEMLPAATAVEHAPPT